MRWVIESQVATERTMTESGSGAIRLVCKGGAGEHDCRVSGLVGKRQVRPAGVHSKCRTLPTIIIGDHELSRDDSTPIRAGCTRPEVITQREQEQTRAHVEERLCSHERAS